ncbi:MAG: CBS domain-containing protein [Bacteroidales bacterium]|nr:CBS domain-containing protein [Bacteroidales bacterium]
MLKNLDKHTISINTSLLDALKQLNNLPDLLTLFVLDNKKKLIGTLTDGDVRRGLIAGKSIKQPLSEFMYCDFKFLKEGEDNFKKLKLFRERRLRAVPLLNKKGQIIKIYDFTKIKSILPLDAVIMAGGEGIRLRPLTNDTPKPLLKIGQKEIISYNFDRLYQFGILNQHITLNYLSEKIVDFCNAYPKDIHFNFIHEHKLLGTAGALSLIQDFKNDTILLMNSDLLTNIDYEDFYKTFIERGADMLVASIPYDITLPYAVFETENRTVNSLKEKPTYTHYANAGIYIFKKKLLKLIPQNKPYNATEFMEDILKNGYSLMHYPIRSYWLDIGKHNDFEKAQKDIAHINWD